MLLLLSYIPSHMDKSLSDTDVPGHSSISSGFWHNFASLHLQLSVLLLSWFPAAGEEVSGCELPAHSIATLRYCSMPGCQGYRRLCRKAYWGWSKRRDFFFIVNRSKHIFLFPCFCSSLPVKIYVFLSFIFSSIWKFLHVLIWLINI